MSSTSSLEKYRNLISKGSLTSGSAESSELHGHGQRRLELLTNEYPTAKTEKDINYLRQLENWGGKLPAKMQISSSITNVSGNRFDLNFFKENWKKHSNKYKVLVDEIREKDIADVKLHGYTFKHVIYTDLANSPYGPELIASVLLSSGFKMALYEMIDKRKRKFRIVIPQPNKAKNTFIVISSHKLGARFFTNVDDKYLQSMDGDIRKVWNQEISDQALQAYNERKHTNKENVIKPGNTYGEKIRFVIIDSAFKEGISIFDVRHQWFTEPPMSLSSFNQAMGRCARYCGSKALPFDQWQLFVHILYSVVTVKDKHTGRSKQQKLFSMLLTDEQKKKSLFEIKMEKLCSESAIDKLLYENINTYKGKPGWKNPEMEFAKLFGFY